MSNINELILEDFEQFKSNLKSNLKEGMKSHLKRHWGKYAVGGLALAGMATGAGNHEEIRKHVTNAVKVSSVHPSDSEAKLNHPNAQSNPHSGLENNDSNIRDKAFQNRFSTPDERKIRAGARDQMNGTKI